MSDIQLGKDEVGDGLVTIRIRHRKTDRFNEGDFKTLKSTDCSICHLKAVATIITSTQRPGDSEERSFGQWARTRLCALLRIAGPIVGVQASRLGNRSLRSGGATATWQAGYEVGVIERWGRWRSASSQGYLWGDYRILSTIGRNMMAMRGNVYQCHPHGCRAEP